MGPSASMSAIISITILERIILHIKQMHLDREIISEQFLKNTNLIYAASHQIDFNKNLSGYFRHYLPNRFKIGRIRIGKQKGTYCPICFRKTYYNNRVAITQYLFSPNQKLITGESLVIREISHLFMIRRIVTHNSEDYIVSKIGGY